MSDRKQTPKREAAIKADSCTIFSNNNIMTLHPSKTQCAPSLPNYALTAGQDCYIDNTYIFTHYDSQGISELF